MPWLLDEDEALKQKLKGFTVQNYADDVQISVPIWYRFPDAEERQRTYPHIAIDLVEVNFDPTRAHRALEYIQTWTNDPEQATPPAGFSTIADDFPLPWILVYQLAAYSRDPVHDRQLAAMLYMQFPEQYGSLDMTSIDGTIRRADLQSVVRRDTVDSDRKRLYRNIFTIAVSSEFYANVLRTTQWATTVDVSFENYVNQPV